MQHFLPNSLRFLILAILQVALVHAQTNTIVLFPGKGNFKRTPAAKPHTSDLKLIDPTLSNRDDLIKQLKDELNITIDKDDPNLFTTGMLLFLQTYFERVQPKGSIHLVATEKTGPKRVWSDQHTDGGTVLYFTQDAGRDLLGNQTPKAKEKTLNGKSELRINFTNTLFDQLSREILSHEKIESIIREEMGVTLEPENIKVSRGGMYFQPWSKTELLTISKDLRDLPPKIRKLMRLKQLYRLVDGHKINKENPLAQYFSLLQRIVVTDQAFSIVNPAPDLYRVNGLDHDPFGHGVLLHEIGHAVAQGLKEADMGLFLSFAGISWEQQGDKWIARKGADLRIAGDLMGRYSDPRVFADEDFAETFSMYVNRSEKLRVDAPQKWKFFYELFDHIVYFTTAHRNAMVKVESAFPDAKAPVMTGGAQDIRVTCQAIDKAIIRCELVANGVEDDVSGIASIKITYHSKAARRFPTKEIAWSASKTGPPVNDAFSSAIELNRDDFQAGEELEPKEIKLKDYAGNESQYISRDLLNLVLPGTGKPEWKQNISPYFKRHPETVPQIAIQIDPQKQGFVKIHFPTDKTESSVLAFLSLNFKKYGVLIPSEARGVTNFQYNFSRTDLLLTDSTIDAEMDLSDLPSGKYSLSVGGYSYGSYGDDVTFDIYYVPQNLILDWTAPRQDAQTKEAVSPETDVNELKVTAEYGKNSDGGDASVRFKLPMNHVNLGGRGGVTLITPTGKELFQFIELAPGADRQTIDVVFPLLANHAAGTYTIGVLDFQKHHPYKSSNPNLWLGVFEGTIRYEFKERGISASIEVPTTLNPAPSVEKLK